MRPQSMAAMSSATSSACFIVRSASAKHFRKSSQYMAHLLSVDFFELIGLRRVLAAMQFHAFVQLPAGRPAVHPFQLLGAAARARRAARFAVIFTVGIESHGHLARLAPGGSVSGE